MKKALVALDSTACSGRNFDRFCDGIRLLQKAGLVPEASIASVYHASLTPLPLEFYVENRPRLMREARENLKQAAAGRFSFKSVKVLHANSTAAEEHVELLSRYGRRNQADVLVVGSNDRTGLPFWLLGSFSETAALRASLPVLVLKPYLPSLSLSKNPKLVVAVDITAPPSRKIVAFLSGLAKNSRASLELVYVVPQKRALCDRLEERVHEREAKATLQTLRDLFTQAGIKSRYQLLKEEKSIAHTVTDFANDKAAWLIVTVAAERSRIRKILLGSSGRRILALTKRPFLSMRLD